MVKIYLVVIGKWLVYWLSFIGGILRIGKVCFCWSYWIKFNRVWMYLVFWGIVMCWV